MTRWKVGLSTGENFTEGSEPFSFVPGQDSPWLKLKAYLKESGAKITSLSLIYNGRTYNLPSTSNNPKFSAFANNEKPHDFDFGRVYGMDDNGHNKDVFSVIEAFYTDKVLQLWIDEKNPNNTWVLVSNESIIRTRK